MHHGLVNGVGGLVGEDARAKARHQLLHLELSAALLREGGEWRGAAVRERAPRPAPLSRRPKVGWVYHDVVVDEDVLAVELHFLRHVGEEPSDLGREVDDVGGLVPRKDGLHRFLRHRRDTDTDDNSD